MQRVSNVYKESMKSSLRERAYIMISFGLVNQEAQAKAKVEKGDTAYFSNSTNVLSEKTDDTVYATLEENFTRVDGSMFFLPRRNTSDTYLDTGIVSNGLISEAQFELTINLNMAATDLKGITIDFGENYPVDFDMVSSSEQVIEIRENTQSKFSTEEVLENTTSLKLVFYTMKNPESRLRIYSIRFGYGLVYYNDSIMGSSLESYISPIGADVPQIDFSVKLKNYDKYFNVDNPDSAIHFLETGQKMDIYYGYQLPTGEVEWIRGNHLLCSEWESDDYTATIKCQDIFRNMDSEYYKGLYNSDGKSYYELATEILQDAGIEDYYIDPQLKELYSKNPIPRVTHKEALQIVANACRCALSQTRTGGIKIKSNFIPQSYAVANSEATYSNVGNILDETEKDEYGTFATNYTTANGAMYFIPRSLAGSINTGFISDEQSKEDCTFDTNPVITIIQEVACMYYGVKLVFGQSIPAEFIIRTYNNGEGELVAEYTVNADEISKTTILHIDFDDFDIMEIEFTKTAEPYNRIVLNNFSFGDITDFTMTRNDMTSSPTAIKQELVKDIIVPCYSYQNGTEEENFISEDVTVVVNETKTYYFDEAAYNFRATFNGATSNVTILDSGNYYVTVKFNTKGTYRLEVYGYKYKVVEQYATLTLHERGKTIKWENPMISDMTMAQDLAEWLGDYYKATVEYEYDTRGNPEIDVNDVVYQENEFFDNMKVNIYRYTLEFNQSFSGSVTARRVGG